MGNRKYFTEIESFIRTETLDETECNDIGEVERKIISESDIEKGKRLKFR